VGYGAKLRAYRGEPASPASRYFWRGSGERRVTVVSERGDVVSRVCAVTQVSAIVATVITTTPKTETMPPPSLSVSRPLIGITSAAPMPGARAAIPRPGSRRAPSFAPKELLQSSKYAGLQGKTEYRYRDSKLTEGD